MKLIKRLFSLAFCVLLLCSCTTTEEESEPILLTQRDTTTPSLSSALTIKREAEETITATQRTIYKNATKPVSGGLSWLAKETTTGSPASIIKQYDVTYDSMGNVLAKTYVFGEDKVIPAVSRVREFGAVLAENTYFLPKFSRYGVDCKGCKGQYTKVGNTAIGIKLDSSNGDKVQQADGTWKEGITWEGYYIVAADKSLPFCTILEISNHNYSGNGIVAGEPFQVIVLDRGGVITNNKLDLYIGSETNVYTSVKYISNKTPVAKVVRVGGLIMKNGKYSCKL